MFMLRTEIGNLMATPSERSSQSVFKEPRPVNPNSLPFFSRIVEDIIVNIFGRLEEDPRDLARLACACRRFRNVIKTSCYKRQCLRVVPCIVSELMQSSGRQDVLVEPPGGWEALQKVLVCCPGLSHAGVLLNCWDYGLEREIGRSDDFEIVRRDSLPKCEIKTENVHEAGTVNTLHVKIKQEPVETQSENSPAMKPEVFSRPYIKQEPMETQSENSPAMKPEFFGTLYPKQEPMETLSKNSPGMKPEVFARPYPKQEPLETLTKNSPAMKPEVFSRPYIKQEPMETQSENSPAMKPEFFARPYPKQEPMETLTKNSPATKPEVFARPYPKQEPLETLTKNSPGSMKPEVFSRPYPKQEPLEIQSENSPAMKPEVFSRIYPKQENKTNDHYQCGTSGKRHFDSACTTQLFDEAGARISSSVKKELLMGGDGPIKQMKTGDVHYHGKVMKEPRFHGSYRRSERKEESGAGSQSSRSRSVERRGSKERSGTLGGGRRSFQTERRINHEEVPHLAKGVWTLTREQGNKLLASRFRSDSLFICDWPGCMHQGERRMYKLFRGIFKNFQHSHVFRNLKDLRAKRTEIRCAFCSEQTYDMVTSFCLRRSFEYHDDGEPVIRAYVCESGHVAGAWTDRPLYNL